MSLVMGSIMSVLAYQVGVFFTVVIVLGAVLFVYSLYYLFFRLGKR